VSLTPLLVGFINGIDPKPDIRVEPNAYKKPRNLTRKCSLADLTLSGPLQKDTAMASGAGHYSI
jgi:hypothetical protein